MSDSPLVSILMPAFNAQGYIAKSIQSIVDQTYSNWNLLICDDGSTDDTFRVINNFLGDPRIKAFQHSRNLKLLKTRNGLLALAKGELLTFQDADDYSDSTRIEKMVREFQANPRLGLLSSQVAYINERGDLLGVSERPTDYETVLKMMYRDNVVGGSYMMIKRHALESIGGKFRCYFDGLSYQDYDLSLIIAEKYECYCLPEPLYYYRQHKTSSSKAISVDRLLAKHVVIYLGRQRQLRGSDDLLDGHPERVDAYFAELRQPYLQDTSLVFREFAAAFMFNKLYGSAIYAAFAALGKRPFKLVNWRTLQYCIRKSLVQRVGGT